MGGEQEKISSGTEFTILFIVFFAGQEGDTLQFDGETKITPFNMNEEMEEGYFDGNGMYIWNKEDAAQIKDAWLDSVDWVKVF